jgi:hypothetical protein
LPPDRLSWLAIMAAWLLASFGTGALLGLLYKRLHPELAFYKLWAFWTVVVSLLAAAAFAIGVV